MQQKRNKKNYKKKKNLLLDRFFILLKSGTNKSLSIAFGITEIVSGLTFALNAVFSFLFECKKKIKLYLISLKNLNKKYKPSM